MDSIHTHCLYTPKNISVGVLEWDCWDCPYHTHCLYTPKNISVVHKWTVHTTHTVYIHPKTSLWECLNGMLDIWTVHLCPTPIQALPQRCFWVYIDSVCGMDSPFMSNTHSSTPTSLRCFWVHTTHTIYTQKHLCGSDMGLLDINGLSIPHTLSNTLKNISVGVLEWDCWT